ncbi:GlxA family transcriptional regulator [Roseovarius aestuarii]|uniref:HTH-type transcriptional regulator CdhR n=1 Tax=Roseovarius aestuarii TaxID=475083 RepID=A0A1X7BL37_9RHOB|nr:GlxA family transcriptional regulator [Roseovarius aestuarii]SMC10353.1 HTH-type transcriptional regulator CdhR [Roseovarius aestuarii]
MPKWTKTPASPVRIAFLLFDQFSNLCLANCLEPLRAANTQTTLQHFEWQIFTPDGAPVLSSSGMQILPHAPLKDLGRCDYLFVTASYHHERHNTSEKRRALRRAAGLARVTVGLDAGPWLMASAGLLDRKRATVHWDLLDAFTEQFLEVEAEQARVVRDGNLMTCAGAMSALDLTLDLISDHLGIAARLAVEALFIHRDPPIGADRDRNADRDPLVSRALGLMRENLEGPLPLEVLARRLSCQPRTLDRRFRARLGAPPGTVYRHLRLASARKLLEGTPLGVAEIAVRCGYESPAALTRAIRKQFGVTPTDLRAAG